jgi:arylsulfatase A-like enzyme
MNWLMIVMESVRYDQFKRTNTPNMDRIGKACRAHSTADWTLPSVTSMMTGMLPHSGLGQPIREKFMRKGMLAEGLWLPSMFQSLGYRTTAYVSVPWLKLIDRGWTEFNMGSSLYRNAKQIADDIKLQSPFFCYLHIGDTHMPYGGDIIPKDAIDGYNTGKETICDMEKLKEMQREEIAFVDIQVGRILKLAPKGTMVVITSDHGELFGEEHKFGHGCAFHEKAFEVPLIVGEA